MKLDKVIDISKRLTDLPYNRFNLGDYQKVLLSRGIRTNFISTEENKPISLMSGNHPNSGIVSVDYSKPNKRKIIIIGKGILFDSGGMDLKLRGMNDMTGDKAGMIIALSIANYLKGNVVAYCPVTTNFIHTSKIIPGDEIKINKKIIKVTNTDAEGRLILAEAISKLNVSENDIIITLATLTGAVSYAIGEKATGVLGINDDLIRAYAISSREADELSWGLPLWEYMEEKYYKGKVIENSIKDIKCGTTEAGLFLKQFIKHPNQWLHLDIAGSAFGEKERANGVPIKSLINFIKRINK